MPRLPEVPHQQAIRAREKGFAIRRHGKHVVMSNGSAVLIIPRHDPINAYTMASFVTAAGLSIDEFKQLL